MKRAGIALVAALPLLLLLALPSTCDAVPARGASQNAKTSMTAPLHYEQGVSPSNPGWLPPPIPIEDAAAATTAAARATEASAQHAATERAARPIRPEEHRDESVGLTVNHRAMKRSGNPKKKHNDKPPPCVLAQPASVRSILTNAWPKLDETGRERLVSRCEQGTFEVYYFETTPTTKRIKFTSNAPGQKGLVTRYLGAWDLVKTLNTGRTHNQRYIDNQKETNSELEEAIRKIADAYNERFRNAPETLRIELQPQIDEMLLGEVDTSGVEVSPAQRRGIAIFWVYSKHPVLGDETLAAGTATLTAALGEEGAREYIRSRRLAGAASRAANRNAAASE